MGFMNKIGKLAKKGAKALKEYQEAEPQRLKEELEKEKAKLKISQTKVDIEKLKEKRAKLSKSPPFLFN